MNLKRLFMPVFWLGILNFKNGEHLKKDKQRINPNSVASQKWWNFCIPEDEKNEIEPIFTEYCF